MKSNFFFEARTNSIELLMSTLSCNQMPNFDSQSQMYAEVDACVASSLEDKDSPVVTKVLCVEINLCFALTKLFITLFNTHIG